MNPVESDKQVESKSEPDYMFQQMEGMCAYCGVGINERVYVGENPYSTLFCCDMVVHKSCHRKGIIDSTTSDIYHRCPSCGDVENKSIIGIKVAPEGSWRKINDMWHYIWPRTMEVPKGTFPFITPFPLQGARDFSHDIGTYTETLSDGRKVLHTGIRMFNEKFFDECPFVTVGWFEWKGLGPTDRVLMVGNSILGRPDMPKSSMEEIIFTHRLIPKLEV